MSERPLYRNILAVIPPVTYINAFVIMGLPELVALFLDSRILAFSLDRTVFILERNRERKPNIRFSGSFIPAGESVLLPESLPLLSELHPERISAVAGFKILNIN